MKTGTMLAATLFAIASFPLLAQQSPASQSDSPATQQNPSGTAMGNPTATPAASIELSPIKGELVTRLDSKSIKTGDSVVVQTKASAKTADGTEIPKGSKLVGHVLAAQPSAAGQNSQVALVFDHLELKGGQSVPIHSQIQSIAPEGDAASASAPAAMNGSPAPAAGGTNSGMGARGAATPATSAAAPATSTGPAAGTIVAKTGQIAISTTSIPGVLLANNAPGEQDPRMTQASSILLGAKQDIQLNSGTQMVVGVAAAGGGAQ
jgi:hypothetical protein